MASVLAVDPERGRHRRCLEALEQYDHRIMVTEQGVEARALVEFHRPSVILLDPDLNDLDGIELCRWLHVWPGAPIIAMCSAPTEKLELALFAAGVDDVVRKPVSTAVLAARIAVQLRHAAHRADPTGEVLEVGDLRIDTASLEAQVGAGRLSLSRRQFTILRVLVHNAGTVVTTDVIARALGRGGDADDRNAVRIAISRLRVALGNGPRTPRIERERAGGYRLVPPAGA